MESNEIPGFDEAAALHRILEGTAAEIGEGFFRELVRNLALALDAAGAWVTEYHAEERRLRSLAFWMEGAFVDEYEYSIADTPCEPVILEARLVHIPEHIVELYPGDNDLERFQAVAYLGAPLQDTDGRVLGNLAVLDTKVLPREEQCEALFRIFTARAAAEHRRLRAEAQVRERREQLTRLVDSALDAIVELDASLLVTRTNPAATALVGHAAALGAPLTAWLEPQCVEVLRRLAARLLTQPPEHRRTWVPGVLQGRRQNGERFPAEATLSCFELDGTPRFTVILRDISARLAAERKIQRLSGETAYLQSELREQTGYAEIAGNSPPLLEVLAKIERVAPTDAAVLIQGESGTGKELAARAIHARSRRHERPLIRVNCAAIPANLMESEFFGHEAGAFTGATQPREGRFALADGGTIFLDEVGELPLDLQSKLLRVLQEDEFERVGSSKTQRADVRVIAATNRDLEARVRAGEFREDLLYRLNVFPLTLPPLRERGADLFDIARALIERAAKRMGKAIILPDESALQVLREHDWPGNIRELQNVIERAVIRCTGETLDLRAALPGGPAMQHATSAPLASRRILTEKELRNFERENICLALDASDGKIAGENGAAERLGLAPSTLSSRMKVLGIRRK